jgi:pimeloyl-ACP methyl ester carboxylesterase
VTLLSTELEVHAGRRVRVAKLGSGPPIVLLHGYPDNLQLYARLLPLLAEARTAIAFDWPGLGESEAQSGGATPEHNAERLLALLDDWGFGEVDLVGFDMGGQPALVLAAKHPSRVRKLIVIGSLVAPEAETSWEITLLRRYGLNRFFLGNFPALVFRRCKQTFLGSNESIPPEVEADFWRSFERPEVRRFLIRMCAGYEARLSRLPELYPAIRAPLLALWGERDAHFPIAHAELLVRSVPNAELAVVPGGHHWMPFVRADEVAARIVAHLNR